MRLYRHLTANQIALKPFPFLREIAMEAYLIENPDVLALDDDELSTVSITDVELPVARGRPSRKGDGRIDLLGLYGESTIAVIELKLGELTQAHLDQLADYFTQKEQIRSALGPVETGVDPSFLGVLVGSGIDQQLRTRIESGYLIEGSIPVAALALTRYRGEDNNVYVVTDTFFHYTGRTYDQTKYRFEGEVYGKNRLVLAVITAYAASHPGVSYAELRAVFPDKIQGRTPGCFSTVEAAQQVIDSTGHRRHFIAPHQLIQLEDATVAVSTQWGIKNIGRFLDVATRLGFQIQPVA